MANKEKKRRRTDPEDDGRTIVPMNVEGMPWYMERPEGQDDQGPHTPMTKEELRTYTWAAVRAGLLIVLIFGLAFFLFIAFCDFVWFKN